MLLLGGHLLLLAVVQCAPYKMDAEKLSQSTAADRMDDSHSIGVTLVDIAKILDRPMQSGNGEFISNSPSYADYRNNDAAVGGWSKYNNVGHEQHRTKRSISATGAQSSPTSAAIDEIRAAIAAAANEIATNEIVLSDELMNAPLSQLDLELIERSPLMKLIRTYTH